MTNLRLKLSIVTFFLVIPLGCGVVTGISGGSFHDKVGWKAEAYFTDPQVIELCDAIEAKNLKRMASLIREGADVNAIGKDGMTPLLWAFRKNNISEMNLSIPCKVMLYIVKCIYDIGWIRFG